MPSTPDPIIDPAMVPDTKVLMGSNVMAYVYDGVTKKKIGYIDEVSIDNNYNLTEIRSLGSYFPIDMKSLKYNGSFDCKFVLLSEPDADDSDVNGADGGLSVEQYMPNFVDLITAKPMLFEFMTKDTGKTIVKLICKLDTDRYNFNTDSPTERRVNFKIIRVQRGDGFN